MKMQCFRKIARTRQITLMRSSSLFAGRAGFPVWRRQQQHKNDNNTSGFGLAVFPAGGGSGSGVGGFGLAVFPAGGGSAVSADLA